MLYLMFIIKNKINLVILRFVTRITLRIFFAAVSLTMCYRVIYDNVLVLALFTAIVNKLKVVL